VWIVETSGTKTVEFYVKRNLNLKHETDVRQVFELFPNKCVAYSGIEIIFLVKFYLYYVMGYIFIL
jgi:hypothetical protein